MARTDLYQEETLEGRLLLWLTDWVTVILLTAGVLFPCLDAYGISSRPTFDLGGVLAFCVFGSLAVSALYTWRYWYWGLLGALAGGGLLFWRLWVHFVEKWENIRLSLDLMDLLEESSAALLLLYALAALVMGGVAIRARVWHLAAALSLLPLLPAIVDGTLPAWGGMLAGFIGWASLLLTSLYSRRNTDSLARARLLSLGGMAALVLALSITLPMEGYQRPQWATNARDTLIRETTRRLDRFFDTEALAERLKTEWGLDLSLSQQDPLGNRPAWTDRGETLDGLSPDRENLLEVGPRRDSDRLIMTVRTDQPNPAGRIYLRGVAFQRYTGTSWERVTEPEDAQPGLYPALTAPDMPEYTMRIRDITFRGVWFYPYRFTGGGELDASGRLVSVARTEYAMPSEAESMLGTAEAYSITYRPGGPLQGFTPLEEPWAEEEARYMDAEMYQEYEAWMKTIQELSQEEESDQAALAGAVFSAVENSNVRGDYLDVPDGLWPLLDALLAEEAEVPEDEALPEPFRAPIAAAARTARWLSSRAVYDPNAPAMEPEGDFITQFLEEGRGYCVHFASAGAMLLRMQGIPARYVTGYVANLNEQGQAQVRGDGAHAWVEIYLSGYGWYPVEMTPSYAGGESGVALEGETEVSDPLEEPQEEPEEDIPEEEETPEEDTDSSQSPEDGGLTPEELPGEEEQASFPWLKLLFDLAMLWAAVCAAYLLGQLLRRQARLDKDANRSALRAYRRYRRLVRLLHGGESETLEELARKAKFSRSGLTAEERETAWRCLDRAVQDAKDRRPPRKRWIVAVLQPVF